MNLPQKNRLIDLLSWCLILWFSLWTILIFLNHGAVELGEHGFDNNDTSSALMGMFSQAFTKQGIVKSQKLEDPGVGSVILIVFLLALDATSIALLRRKNWSRVMLAIFWGAVSAVFFLLALLVFIATKQITSSIYPFIGFIISALITRFLMLKKIGQEFR